MRKSFRSRFTYSLSVRKRYPEKYTNLLVVYSLTNIMNVACTCTQGVYSCFIKRLLRDHWQQHPQSDSPLYIYMRANNGRLRSRNGVSPLFWGCANRFSLVVGDETRPGTICSRIHRKVGIPDIFIVVFRYMHAYVQQRLCL